MTEENKNARNLEIQLLEHFTYFYNNQYRKLESVNAYSFKENTFYGVAIEVPDELEFAEQFNKVSIVTKRMEWISNHNFLVFQNNHAEYRFTFVNLCMMFLDPERRSILSTNPTSWTEEMSNLIGNSKSKKDPYSVIGEMIVYAWLYQQNKNIKWVGPDRASCDLEDGSSRYEVKSTKSRESYDITISSSMQLIDHTTPLELFFVRLEESQAGYSINALVQILKNLGVDPFHLEDSLSSLSFPQGNRKRNLKYRLQELNSYAVDSNFPKISPQSFKTDTLPAHVKSITYTIDLTGIPIKSNLKDAVLETFATP